MLRVGLAQVNATVGDLAGNAEIIVEWTRRAAARGARVVVFPEMALTGYPVEDLALRASFVEASIAAVRDVAERLNVEGLGGVAVVAGYLDRRAGLAPRTGLPAGAPLDAAAVLHGGRVVITSAKHHLPNYGVFDEFRYFVPGDTCPVFRLPVTGAGGEGAAGEWVDVAVAICEDLWQDGGPVAVTRHAGAGLLVVPNASPYERGKDDVRLELVRRRAREAGAALAYCNLVGGQDELVFDGDSILVSASGELLARGPQFQEALIIADLELPSAKAGPGPESVADRNDIRPAAGGTLPRTSGAGEAVDAGDGTVITVERVTLPEIPEMPPTPSIPGAPGDPGSPASGNGSRGTAAGAGTAEDAGTAANAGAAAGGGTDAEEVAAAGGAPAAGDDPNLRPGGTAPAGDAGDAGPFWPRLDDLAEVYAALVLGTADYVRKNGFRSVLLALSGGIDSALVATIAADAVGPENVHVILMPSKWSSGHSVTDAEDLVERQGINARTIAIQPIVDAFRDGLESFPESGLPAENLQSRVRGVINMAVSNDEGHLVLTTGNKSEIATGYSTLYGDSAGGFGPIKDVPKTLVWALARWRNAEAQRLGRTPPIPQQSIDKPPSAELAPGQLDTDSLPDYETLDALLDDYVEQDMGSAELIAAGHDPGLVERVIRLVDLAEYKRRQYPPGPKISQKNFGRDRRLPITSRWRESLPG
jgi:NAD+ synthase (glutamine-hydrolysing)